MGQRWVGLMLGLALGACSADENGSGGGRGRPMSPGPTPGAAGSPTTGAAGGAAGDSSFGNPTMGSMQMIGNGMPNNNPNNICEVVRLTAKPSTPDVLIVLDRSGSMQREGRWLPSLQAVRTITMDLQDRVNFGLALFPQQVMIPDAVACLSMTDPVQQMQCIERALRQIEMAGNGTCTPGNIVVPVGPMNAPMIHAQLDMTISQGGTPTGETLQNLVGTFGAPPTNPDVIPPPRFVLLVTDGQPTCPNGGGQDTNQADIDIANTAIEMLKAMGVPTYVIGYDTSGPGNEMFAAVLDGFAVRGGTGDMMHRPVEDEQSLRTEFQRIAGDVISCTFQLDKAPPRADYVLVKVDGVQVNLNDPNGWMLTGDRTIELNGSTCEKLKADGNHQVEAEVRCQVVTPI